MSIEEKIDERIELARSHQEDTNCRGTALYIVGVIPDDKYLESDETRVHVDAMPTLDEPVKYCLAVYRKDNGNIAHMGVVHDLVTPRILHRWRDGNPLTQTSVDLAGSADSKLEYRDSTPFSQF
ncbi:MAG: hypothetical protein IH934_02360 [Nanoarchaeota archaeon]|nr:hypothetical protein [Nanoarchaeota archaeon]